jgi:hypothetical protein
MPVSIMNSGQSPYTSDDEKCTSRKPHSSWRRITFFVPTAFVRHSRS